MLSAIEDHQLKIFVCAKVLAICVFSVNCYTVPEPHFEQLIPRGFSVSIPETSEKPGISLFAFHGAVDRRLQGGEIGDFSGEVRVPTCDRWEYKNEGVILKPGQRIYYWIHVKQGLKRYRLLDKSYEVLDREAYEEAISHVPFNNYICNVAGGCEWSKTTVQGQKVCQGELIFEENFDLLDSVVWKREIRIPLDVDDADFVVYQDRKDNAYIVDGKLYIEPTRLDKVPGYSEATVRNGVMDLGEKCTGIYNREWECRRQAGFFQILPPVVSARINTKQSFSFRFGKIEIRAKLPKGDWLFPLLVLDPLTRDYGMTGYQSGQMRVAYIRANEHLETKEGVKIDGSQLLGREILWPGQTLDTSNYYLPTREHCGNAFHTYSLTWNNHKIILKYDGQTYVSKKLPNGPHPFETEFYVSLGVSAGGMSDFPDGSLSNGNHKPWKNKHPKAELHFWNARDEWYSTWHGGYSSLIIDYVKVWAL